MRKNFAVCPPQLTITVKWNKKLLAKHNSIISRNALVLGDIVAWNKKIIDVLADDKR